MQADIDRTRSRMYNYFLRSLHVGLRIIVAVVTTSLIKEPDQCVGMFDRFAYPLTIAIIVVNVLSIIVSQCSQKLPRRTFFLSLGLNIILFSVLGLLTYSLLSNSSVCSKKQILQTYMVLEILFSVPQWLLILCFPAFAFAQRYPNTPGNVIWTILIIMFMNSLTFSLQMQIICSVNGLISVGALVINVIALVHGMTPKLKKAIVVEWVLGLILIVVCVLIALVTYLNNYYLNEYENIVLRNVTLRFILIEVLDLAFWIWGLLTLTYENGDMVRSAIIYDNQYRNQGLNDAEWRYATAEDESQHYEEHISPRDSRPSSKFIEENQQFMNHWLDIRNKK